MDSRDSRNRAREAKHERGRSAIQWLIERAGWIAALAAAVVAITYFLSFWKLPFAPSPSAFGEFGDYFGGVMNPLVALLALIALAFSIRVQQRELAATNLALENQYKLAERQTSIQVFFELIRLRNEQVAALRVWERMGTYHAVPIDGPANVLVGLAAISDMASSVFGDLDQHANVNSDGLQFLATSADKVEPILAVIFRTSEAILWHLSSMESTNDREKCATVFAGLLTHGESRLFLLWLCSPTKVRLRQIAVALAVFRNFEPAWLRQALLSAATEA